ncbi:MAG TPA: IS110 family transposase [Verrucomicrobiales bacterium]|nr:IS110 family transposase [Verrucomicrobiales bacterium]
MNPYAELTHFAGFDWAKDHHDVIIVDVQGKIITGFRMDHTVEGWRTWREKTAAYPRLGVAIETSFGAAVEQLLESAVSVYPVNPASAKRYRERKCASGNKTDRHDAWALADALRLDGQAWRALQPQDPIVAELRILCRDEVALIEERTALVNQLQQALHEYYPAAEEAFDDWTQRSAWAFVERFPTAEALTRAGKRQWEKFLHTHKLNRPETFTRRMEIFARAGEWKVSAPMVAAKSFYAVAKCRQLRLLENELHAYRRRIEALFASHPDSSTFGSLPGAGPKLAPRLLGEIGSDRTLYEDAGGLQCMAGTAPVSYQSGQIHRVSLRHRCNKMLRQTIHHLARLSRAQCTWAANYYDALRERGKTDAQALRSLGQRWLKIIWKMWQTRTCYDPELHLKNQLAHGSWVLSFQPSTPPKKHAKNFSKKATCNG